VVNCMDLKAIFLISFFALIAVFFYPVHKLYKRDAEPRVWIGDAILTLLGFSMFISGFLSGDVVEMIIGSAMMFAGSSLFLTRHVKCEHRAKRFLEVIFSVISLGIIVYGYFVTGSLILGLLTLFIAAMILTSFILSYLLPRARR